MNSHIHNAIILSIVDVTNENKGIGIFEFIKLMISETNWILSPGERDFGPTAVSIYVQRHIDGVYSYPLYSQHPGTFREKSLHLYRDCLVKIHKLLDGYWETVSWYELLTYLMFIQSNCHHSGHIKSHKLCRNSDSFLNFFYKSKNAFNPWSKWEKKGDNPRMDLIEETKEAELRGEWWVNAFKREKYEFLMFHTLEPNYYLGERFTTGWNVTSLNENERDFLPYGSVINQLREYLQHFQSKQL